MTELIRARNVEEAFDALDTFALVRPSDPFFADIEADLPREHYGVSEELKRHFRAIRKRPRWHHVASSGTRARARPPWSARPWPSCATRA